MTLYSGMNNTSGKVITDIDHLRQSVRDILLTPQGSRIARREYGSLLSVLIDQPQNPALRLQVMSAVYVALSRWEPRLMLDSITINSNFDGSMVVELTGRRNNGVPVSLSVSTGAENGSDCLHRRLWMCRTLRRCLPNARQNLWRFIRKMSRKP